MQRRRRRNASIVLTARFRSTLNRYFEFIAFHLLQLRHRQLLAHIRTIPEIILLGSMCETVKRLPTVCFMVRHSRGAYLHHRFVVAVLNDVFGIQATAHNTIVEAMSISPQLAVQYEQLQLDRSSGAGDDGAAADRCANECLAPGYTQIQLPFFMPDAEVGFVLEALKMVATEAWKLLPQYECDRVTAEWRHQSNALLRERKLLGAIRYTDGRMLCSDRRISGPGLFPQSNADCLQTARNLFNRARKMSQRAAMSMDGAGSAGGAGGGGGGPRTMLHMLGAQAEALRWYMLPGEANELLLGHSQNVKHVVPFDPNKCEYFGGDNMISYQIMLKVIQKLTCHPNINSIFATLFVSLHLITPAAIEPHSVFNIYRHYSLPALDTRRFKSQSMPTSPIHNKHHQQFASRQHQQHTILRQQSSPSPTPMSLRQQSPIPERREPPVTPPPSPSHRPLPVFSLGGEVTAALRTPPSPSATTASTSTTATTENGESDEPSEEETVDAPTRRNRWVFGFIYMVLLCVHLAFI